MMPIIVPAYAAILAFVYIFLSARVIHIRGSAQILIGTGGDAALERRIRAHANFAEYVPLALILLTFLEMQEHSRYLIHFLTSALVAGRIAHAIGISQGKRELGLRVTGMIMTFSVLLISGLVLLLTPFVQY